MWQNLCCKYNNVLKLQLPTASIKVHVVHCHGINKVNIISVSKKPIETLHFLTFPDVSKSQ